LLDTLCLLSERVDAGSMTKASFSFLFSVIGNMLGANVHFVHVSLHSLRARRSCTCGRKSSC
jgi:hypothetical protein